MKPVMMTCFGWPDGNCFAASFASIFEVGLEDLPAGACPPRQAGEPIDYWTKPWNEWLWKRGLQLVACEAWQTEVDGKQEMYKMPGYSILSCAVLGAPPMADGTELRHAVVALDGEILHDPLTGDLRALPQLWPREYNYFMVLDPTKLGKMALDEVRRA